MDDTRMQKINSQMQQLIAEIIRNDVKNPSIEGIVSVTNVETTRDLKHAKVYISIFNSNTEKNKTTFDAICSAKNFIRHQVATQVNWHCVPQLAFLLDDSLDKTQRINDLLKEINEKE